MEGSARRTKTWNIPKPFADRAEREGVVHNDDWAKDVS